MEPFPHPQEPTTEEIFAEEKQIHAILFSAIPVHVICFIAALVLIAIAISYNFNVMCWLE